jgi:hypothetical protein
MKKAFLYVNPNDFEDTISFFEDTVSLDLNKTQERNLRHEERYRYESWYLSNLNYVHVDNRVCNFVS